MPAKTRYPSDLTDAQWALVEPLLSVVKPGGRPEAHARREVVNAILYLLRTGCSWRQLPKNFPPWETVYWHFKRWRDDGSLDALHAAIIDAQSVKGADTASRGRAGTTRARRSIAASVTSWSTRSGCW